MKKFLGGQRFGSDEEVKSVVCRWLYAQKTEFYERGVLKSDTMEEICRETWFQCRRIEYESHHINLTRRELFTILQVKSSVNAMLRYNEEKSTKKFPSLFMDEKQLIYLTVECIKIPVMPKRNFRFCLPHPLVDRSSDVCLFVPDLKKGKREDHEPTKEYYNDILQKNNISGISEIMPLRQVRVEYDQYELRRRLVDQYDLFLCDGRISGHILHLLGKEVYRKRKLPVPVDFRVKNLNEQVEKAFSKTLMMMHGNGKKCSLKIGHTKLSVDQITENIMDVAKDLAEHYPGGWTNIRSLHIHMQDMPEIPVYISFKSSNEVEVPVVKPVVPKKAVPVEGELSTFPGTSVIVMPSGEVIVKKMKKTKEDIEMDISDSDWEDFDSVKEMDSEKEDSDDVEETSKDGSEEEDEKDKNDDSDSNENGYSEHLTEAAENAYLNEWSMKWNEGIKSMEKEKKRKMKNETNDIEVRKKKKKIEEQNETALDTIKQEHKNLQKERQKRDKAFKIGKKQHTVLKMENETNDKEMRKKKKAEQNKNALDITKQEPKILQKKKQKGTKLSK
ncbi:hypothetical protein ANN_06139 [Periplaneta americana]|uniref:Ribosomal protein L1 n=1 Tax=Periplaneta americana TaxID=6978 RepID=A0ABQ8TEW4_PERAM|nr:hypothetical protein ANN_06139 [Periplaneta americana]